MIGYGFCDTGMAVPVSMDMLVNGVMPIDISSWVNCKSYSSNNNLRLFCTGVETSWQVD